MECGRPAHQIVKDLDLSISVRQIQRVGEKFGNRKMRASGRRRADQDSVTLYRPIIEPLMSKMVQTLMNGPYAARTVRRS